MSLWYEAEEHEVGFPNEAQSFPSELNTSQSTKETKTMNRYFITTICILWAVLAGTQTSNSTPITFDHSVPNELTVWIDSTEAFNTPLPYGAASILPDTPESFSALLVGYDQLDWLEIVVKWNHPGITVDDTFRWIPGGPITEFDGASWNDIGIARSFTYRVPFVPDGGSVLMLLGMALTGLSVWTRR